MIQIAEVLLHNMLQNNKPWTRTNTNTATNTEGILFSKYRLQFQPTS